MICPSWRVAWWRRRLAGDRGTMIPMIMLCFLLAGTFGCASIAASAAFLAQRDLAGACDGAAVAAANAASRAAVGTMPIRLRRSPVGVDNAGVAGTPAVGTMPIQLRRSPLGGGYAGVAGAGTSGARVVGLRRSPVGGDDPGVAGTGAAPVRLRRLSGAGDIPAGTGIGAADPARSGRVGARRASAGAGADADGSGRGRFGRGDTSSTGDLDRPYTAAGSGTGRSTTSDGGGVNPYRASDSGDGAGVDLPLDPDAVERAVAGYQTSAAVGGSPIRMTAITDGQAVTVTCQRTVQIPFGRLLGYPDGLGRTAIAHARSPLD
jgi:hypothetical protein